MANYCKIVIIDDEFIMRQGMKHMLEWEKEGFQIVGEASNGQEGLEVIEQTKPHIVLADIVMPVLDGIEFSEILQKRFPDIKLIILSSYDKFEYVKKTLLNGAIDYILKPTLNPEILLTTLNHAVKNIPGLELEREENGFVLSQLERFFCGYQDKLDEMVFAESFPYTLYRILGVNLKKAGGNQKDKMMLIRDSILQFFLEEKEYVHIDMLLEEEMWCMIFNYRLKDEKRVLAKIEMCVSKIAKMYGNVFFVVGKSYSDMQDIKQCYQTELKEMVEQQFYYKGRTLFVLEQKYTREKEERFTFSEYTNLLNHREYGEALRMFGNYIYYLCEQKVDEYRLRNLTKNLLYNYLMEIEKFEIDSEELRRKYFLRIDAVQYVDEFMQVFQKVMEELNELRVQRIEVEDIKILEIKRYIKEHYQESLELAEIAEKFSFNYHYLSSYFNRYAKEGFSGYLNKIRIEKACELLKQGELSVSEISGKIGYADHSYFCRVFKKITGDTPSQYKRKMKKE